MNCKPNIGTMEALIRITIGLTILSCTTAKLVKKPWRESTVLFAICGAMKVGEGIVRFCPTKALFKWGQNMMEDKEIDLNDMIPNNPT